MPWRWEFEKRIDGTLQLEAFTAGKAAKAAPSHVQSFATPHGCLRELDPGSHCAPWNPAGTEDGAASAGKAEGLFQLLPAQVWQGARARAWGINELAMTQNLTHAETGSLIDTIMEGVWFAIFWQNSLGSEICIYRFYQTTRCDQLKIWHTVDCRFVFYKDL